MKKSILFLLFCCFVFNAALAQEELYVNLWYGQIKNEDVERHLELEEKFYKKFHQQRIASGEILGWDLWKITNPDPNEMTTTFIYAHLMPKATAKMSPVDQLAGVSKEDWANAQKEAMGHYLKNYQVLVSLKGGYGPQATGEPADYAVLNYMEVDNYRAAEYEAMELETFMPIHQEQGTKSGWGLHKVLNHFGAEKPVNYITADFYEDLETIYAGYNATEPMGKEGMNSLKKMDEMRTLARSHIVQRLMSVR